MSAAGNFLCSSRPGDLWLFSSLLGEAREKFIGADPILEIVGVGYDHQLIRLVLLEKRIEPPGDRFGSAENRCSKFSRHHLPLYLRPLEALCRRRQGPGNTTDQVQKH